LLKTEVTQRYHDPLVHAVNDLQEFAQRHYQISGSRACSIASPVRPPSPATPVRPLSKKPGPSSGGRSINTAFSRISMTRRGRVWASQYRRTPRRFRCSA
jgi:hypothetical protein